MDQSRIRPKVGDRVDYTWGRSTRQGVVISVSSIGLHYQVRRTAKRGLIQRVGLSQIARIVPPEEPSPREVVVLKHLKQLVELSIGSRDHAYFAYLQEHGTLKVGAKTAYDHPVLSSIPDGRKPKECYRNSKLLSLVLDGVDYIEGIAFLHYVPLDHAWILYEGELYDPTWGQPDRNRIDKAIYFGVKVPSKYVEETIGSERTWITPLRAMIATMDV